MLGRHGGWALGARGMSAARKGGAAAAGAPGPRAVIPHPAVAPVHISMHTYPGQMVHM